MPQAMKLSALDAPNPGPRLLVVDDEAGIVAALGDYFTGIGYTVDAVTEAGQAMDLLDRFEYAAIVTDLRLSAGNGDDGLGVLARARRKNPQAACIVLTAFGDADNER